MTETTDEYERAQLRIEDLIDQRDSWKVRALDAEGKLAGVDEAALTAAELAVRAQLVEWRDRRFSSLTSDGFVINEADGSMSAPIRMSTRDGLQIAITAYLAAIGGQQA